jgi:hypothetical protein
LMCWLMCWLTCNRASLLLHEYEESAICFNQLHEKQQMELTELLHKRNAMRACGGADTGDAKSEEEGEVKRGEEGETVEDLERQIDEMKANIETTNGWLRKVEKGKRAYKV